MWWWHKQNTPMTFAGKVLRKAAVTPVISRPVRVLEEQLFCRRGRAERSRRAEAVAAEAKSA